MNYRNTKRNSENTLITFLTALIVFGSSSAFADNDDETRHYHFDTEVSASSSEADDASSYSENRFLSGLGGSGASVTVLRFSNTDSTSGTVSLTLYNATLGNELATWTSGVIPPRGSIEVTTTQIATAALPALSPSEIASAYNARASATFEGTVQEISLSNGEVANQSGCGEREDQLGFVEGPGYAGLQGFIRVVNQSATAGSVTLALFDAANGDQLGTWTSSSVPANAAITISTSSIAAAAEPPIPETVTVISVTMLEDELIYHGDSEFQLEHLAVATGGATFANLSAACEIGGDSDDRLSNDNDSSDAYGHEEDDTDEDNDDEDDDDDDDDDDHGHSRDHDD
ncbi:MAG: hypothetical protein RJS98_10965 [Rhodospirillaceae bacterium]